MQKTPIGDDLNHNSEFNDYKIISYYDI